MAQRGDTVVIAGTDYLGMAAVNSGETVLPGAEVWGTYVSLEALYNTRVGVFGELYERYKIKKFVVHAVGAQPTTSTSMVMLWYDADPSDQYVTGDGAIHCAMAHDNSGEFKLWENARLSVPARHTDKLLYTNKGVDMGVGTATDQRLYAAGWLSLIAILPVPAGAVASMWVDYEIEFSVPQLQRDSPAVNAYASPPLPIDAGSYGFSNRYFPADFQATGKVLAGEKPGEAKWVGDALKRILLPAGRYIIETMLDSFTDDTCSARATVMSGLQAGTYSACWLSTEATPVDGGSSPLSNARSSVYVLNPSQFPLNNMHSKGWFELARDSYIRFLTGGYNITFANAARLVMGLVLHRISHKGHFGVWTAADPAETTVDDNSDVYRMIHNASTGAYMVWDSRYPLPDGWAYCDGRPPPTTQDVVLVTSSGYSPASRGAAPAPATSKVR